MAAVAAEPVTHPLITPYPGSKPGNSERKEYDVYKLVTGVEEGQPVGRELEGSITRLSYYHPRERSILEVFRNYETALTEAGMKVLFTCAGDECGPAYASSAWNRFNGITAKSGADCRYLVGELTTPEGAAYVGLMVGRSRHQIDIVEIEEMDTGMVTVNAEALAEGIRRDGRVSVYGIYFDTGKATLKTESKPALDEIARLMREMADLKIYVVGHTDSTGAFDANMSLSRERAQSVVRELVRNHGIGESRLSGHGVGPLAPASTNRSDPGRSKNRRVDLVEQ